MKTIVIATKNAGKAREYQEMLAPLGIQVKTLADFAPIAIDENGETFTFNASRAKVMEHVERFAKHPELYITNKTLVVAHFHAMAMAFYAMAHLPKER